MLEPTRGDNLTYSARVQGDTMYETENGTDVCYGLSFIFQLSLASNGRRESPTTRCCRHLQAVQVGTMTTLLPPASFELLYKTPSGITVLHRKRRMVCMTRERFSCNIDNLSLPQKVYDMNAKKSICERP